LREEAAIFIGFIGKAWFLIQTLSILQKKVPLTGVGVSSAHYQKFLSARPNQTNSRYTLFYSHQMYAKRDGHEAMADPCPLRTSPEYWHGWLSLTSWLKFSSNGPSGALPPVIFFWQNKHQTVRTITHK
jgi:hypothetical protein